jgi:hypothetical protein
MGTFIIAASATAPAERAAKARLLKEGIPELAREKRAVLLTILVFISQKRHLEPT